MKLAQALIAKSIAETVLVASLAVVLYLNAFPPSLHGWGEVQPHGISGWAVNHSDPWQRLEVQLFIDGKFVSNATANQSRPDVMAAGWARDEWHGYNFKDLSLDPGIHLARIYALHSSRREAHQTLQILGDPIWFTVDEAGVLHSWSEITLRKIR